MRYCSCYRGLGQLTSSQAEKNAGGGHCVRKCMKPKGFVCDEHGNLTCGRGVTQLRAHGEGLYPAHPRSWIDW